MASSSRTALLHDRARFMRFHPTPSEERLFAAMRGRRLGVVFRRQQVIGNFIVDFLARSAMLIVEVDGDAYHARRAPADVARDMKLMRLGYRVMRIPASLVMTDLGAAVARIRAAL